MNVGILSRRLRLTSAAAIVGTILATSPGHASATDFSFANFNKFTASLQQGDAFRFFEDFRGQVFTTPADETPAAPAPTLDLVETAVNAGSFTTLAAALEATGLIPVLQDQNTKFTVFAPTDEAFAALGQDTINALLNDTETLKQILLYHVISGREIRADRVTRLAQSDRTKRTASSEPVQFSARDAGLFINDSQIVATDVLATNGVIHVIDAVLTPPSLVSPEENTLSSLVASNPDFSTLKAALELTGLDAVLGNPDSTFTVFAPNNRAFKQLGSRTLNALLENPDQLRDILLYHVIPDQQGAVYQP